MDSFKDKSVLITGATGLIGSNLVDRLMQSDIAKLIVTGRSKKKLESTFLEYARDERFAIVEHDASTPYPETIKDIDFIFHAAGPMERDVVMNRPVTVVLPNILGTINSLEFLRKQEILNGRKGRIIIFSSVTVYSNPSSKDYIAVESDTTHAISLDQPYSCYAESKRMAEVIAQSYKRQYDVDIVIARFSTVYGWCKNIPETAFFEFINKALVNDTIVLKGNGIPKRDNIYVDDAVDGLITVALKGMQGEAYNISSNGDLGNYVAIDEIAQQIANAVSIIKETEPVKVIKPIGEEMRKPGLQLSNIKLKELGWVLKTEHFDGIKKTILKMI